MPGCCVQGHSAAAAGETWPTEMSSGNQHQCMQNWPHNTSNSVGSSCVRGRDMKSSQAYATPPGLNTTYLPHHIVGPSPHSPPLPTIAVAVHYPPCVGGGKYTLRLTLWIETGQRVCTQWHLYWEDTGRGWPALLMKVMTYIIHVLSVFNPLYTCIMWILWALYSVFTLLGQLQYSSSQNVDFKDALSNKLCILNILYFNRWSPGVRLFWWLS